MTAIAMVSQSRHRRPVFAMANAMRMGTERYIMDTTSRGAANPREDTPLTEAMTATEGIKEMAVVMVPTTPTAQASTNWIVRVSRGFSAITSLLPSACWLLVRVRMHRMMGSASTCQRMPASLTMP